MSLHRSSMIACCVPAHSPRTVPPRLLAPPAAVLYTGKGDPAALAACVAAGLAVHSFEEFLLVRKELCCTRVCVVGGG